MCVAPLRGTENFEFRSKRNNLSLRGSFFYFEIRHSLFHVVVLRTIFDILIRFFQVLIVADDSVAFFQDGIDYRRGDQG